MLTLCIYRYPYTPLIVSYCALALTSDLITERLRISYVQIRLLSFPGGDCNYDVVSGSSIYTGMAQPKVDYSTSGRAARLCVTACLTDSVSYTP